LLYFGVDPFWLTVRVGYMTLEELINNARVCAADAIVLLDSVEKLSDPTLKANTLLAACSMFKVGSDEARLASTEAILDTCRS
jgi:SHS2 domain-containing protein